MGLGILIGGGHTLISGAVEAVQLLGVSEAFIAIALVAFGTSLPELATAVGNTIGSNALGLLGVLGVTALVTSHEGTDVRLADIGVMVLTSVGVYSLMRSDKLTRLEGAALLVVYAAYVGWMFIGREIP